MFGKFGQEDGPGSDNELDKVGMFVKVSDVRVCSDARLDSLIETFQQRLGLPVLG